ncbi:hypothetical protein [Bathymodiolus platifrons methanotrophic gill symbiont]|uniref:hypothetical protein n=1 Tax=Bathymodiolus platifrons methanotrophic gill symbiont TaxID=113268 RepID=UPI001C8DA1A2|nr:hypothetical protein [Bathymodiolus platifrons methanotrophic gill symbiont]
MAKTVQKEAKSYTVNLYGKQRAVRAYGCVVMLKTLKRPVQVVWVFRRTQWIALFSTDLNLSVTQMIEYYGARWKQARHATSQHSGTPVTNIHSPTQRIYAPSRVFMIDFGTPCHKNRFAARRIIYALARPASTSPMHKNRMA